MGLARARVRALVAGQEAPQASPIAMLCIVWPPVGAHRPAAVAAPAAHRLARTPAAAAVTPACAGAPLQALTGDGGGGGDGYMGVLGRPAKVGNPPPFFDM